MTIYRTPYTRREVVFHDALSEKEADRIKQILRRYNFSIGTILLRKRDAAQQDAWIYDIAHDWLVSRRKVVEILATKEDSFSEIIRLFYSDRDKLPEE